MQKNCILRFKKCFTLMGFFFSPFNPDQFKMQFSTATLCCLVKTISIFTHFNSQRRSECKSLIFLSDLLTTRMVERRGGEGLQGSRNITSTRGKKLINVRTTLLFGERIENPKQKKEKKKDFSTQQQSRLNKREKN